MPPQRVREERRRAVSRIVQPERGRSRVQPASVPPACVTVVPSSDRQYCAYSRRKNKLSAPALANRQIASTNPPAGNKSAPHATAHLNRVTGKAQVAP